MHPDGYVELRDRAKDVIISGGENISSVEVEQVLAATPPSSRRRWWPCRTRSGASGRRPSSSSSPAGELEARSCSRSAARTSPATRCPAAVEFGELPQTVTGKIQKFVLREREWSGREKAIQ